MCGKVFNRPITMTISQNLRPPATGLKTLDDKLSMRPPATDLKTLDDKLSKRFIALDPDGYFLIYLDENQGLICAKHFTNVINDKGLACDPETGKPLIAKKNDQPRQATRLYQGRTAKELCLKIFEDKENPCPISYLDHAAYLGREFVRAELALINGEPYVQD